MENAKTIPIPFNEVSDIFLNPDKKYLIDLKNSKLKGESFIIYLANMKLNCYLVKDPELKKEDKYDVIHHFLKYPYLVACPTLVGSILAVFLKSRNIPFNNTECWLSDDEIDDFIKNNSELIKDISDFYDSLILGLASYNVNFKNNFLEPAIKRGEVELVEDPSLISVNALSLLKIPNFLENFISYKEDAFSSLKYYKYQIEKFTYDKKPLFDIIMDLKENSFLMSLVNIFFSDEKEEKEILEKNLKILGVV